MNRTVTLELPEDLIERAEQAGLLTDENISRILEVELEREERCIRYLETLEELRSAEESPITPEEIAAEIKAHRAEKAATRRTLSV